LAISTIALRQAGGEGTSTLDNLYVSDNFSEALTGTAVPEPASLGVLALGGLALLARRRK
jgi:hypothetical protein